MSLLNNVNLNKITEKGIELIHKANGEIEKKQLELCKRFKGEIKKMDSSRLKSILNNMSSDDWRYEYIIEELDRRGV